MLKNRCYNVHLSLEGLPMKLKDILHEKGRSVLTISPEAMLSDVVAKLVEHNCGSLVVCDEHGRMIGIITERDILRACATHAGTLDEMPVEKFMTHNVVTGSLDDQVDSIMGVLTRKRIRHLPVLEKGKLVGMVSIGDIVKAQHDRLSMENHYLKEYIQS
jgi:CBS domain-containing protein